MYPLRSLNVPLGVHVPQFGNPWSIGRVRKQSNILQSNKKSVKELKNKKKSVEVIKKLKRLQFFLLSFNVLSFFAYANVFRYEFIIANIMINDFGTEKNFTH